jgi:hypothetical protein
MVKSKSTSTYIHTYHSRFIPVGVAEVSQVFLRDTPIAILLQSISGGSAINPLVVIYDIHGGKKEVLFFYFVLDTTRDKKYNDLKKLD